MEDLTTCEISDALIKLGSPHGGHIPDIYPISPTSSTNASDASTPIRVEGPAHTVKMVLFNDKVSPKPMKHFVDAAEEGTVIVIDAPLSKHYLPLLVSSLQTIHCVLMRINWLRRQVCGMGRLDDFWSSSTRGERSGDQWPM